MTTFEFRSEKSFFAVVHICEMANYKYASYCYKSISVFDDETAEKVREICKGLKVKEV